MRVYIGSDKRAMVFDGPRMVAVGVIPELSGHDVGRVAEISFDGVDASGQLIRPRLARWHRHITADELRDVCSIAQNADLVRAHGEVEERTPDSGVE